MEGPVHILGAGVGGLTSAIVLALNGKEVVVHEKRDRIGGSFTCTVHGMLNYRNPFPNDALAFFRDDIGLQIARSFHPIATLRRYSPSGYTYATENQGQPIAYTFMRGSAEGSLDAELLSQAIGLGVKVRYDSKGCAGSSQIVATGPRYCDLIGCAAHFRQVDLDDLAEAKVFFDSRFAPGGYAYILPFSDGSATVGVVALRRRVCKTLKSYWETLLEHLAARLELRLDEKQPVAVDTGVGHYNLHNSFRLGNHLFVGAAAGLMTADYGFALKNAVLSGYLASEALLADLDYDRLVMTRIYPELARAYLRRLRMNISTDSDVDTAVLKRAAEPSRVRDSEWTSPNSSIRNLVAWILSSKRRHDYPLSTSSRRHHRCDCNP